ncbi:Vesicle transport protein [Vigna unguiculata]|uniref:Vesicle transport protein n=1 Tax=Vigna unguiculata TaxID=3917 RepID=A0A4D6M4Y1_VIGUN|nr:Vesicle transport protein [Vigna unguiculata]
MEKMNRAFEKVKIMVGMDVEDEEQQAAALENSNSFAFVDDFNRNCTLSTTQRLYGFAICFAAGLTCTLLSMLVFFKPIKFAIAFTLGNLLSLGSTAFLIGPKRQVTMMLDPVRIYATSIYIASMIIALFCALYRLYGFAICFAAGLTCTLLNMAKPNSERQPETKARTLPLWACVCTLYPCEC